MSLRILKYALKFQHQKTLMPRGAKILTLQMEPKDDELYAWAIVDTDAQKTDVQYRVFGTGSELSADVSPAYYAGTVQVRGSFGQSTTLHVFIWEAPDPT